MDDWRLEFSHAKHCTLRIIGRVWTLKGLRGPTIGVIEVLGASHFLNFPRGLLVCWLGSGFPYPLQESGAQNAQIQIETTKPQTQVYVLPGPKLLRSKSSPSRHGRPGARGRLTLMASAKLWDRNPSSRKLPEGLCKWNQVFQRGPGSFHLSLGEGKRLKTKTNWNKKNANCLGVTSSGARVAGVLVGCVRSCSFVPDFSKPQKTWE